MRHHHLLRRQLEAWASFFVDLVLYKLRKELEKIGFFFINQII